MSRYETLKKAIKEMSNEELKKILDQFITKLDSDCPEWRDELEKGNDVTIDIVGEDKKV